MAETVRLMRQDMRSLRLTDSGVLEINQSTTLLAGLPHALSFTLGKR
jgi:hypothetical protein